jgi:hypothetical protein
VAPPFTDDPTSRQDKIFSIFKGYLWQKLWKFATNVKKTIEENWSIPTADREIRSWGEKERTPRHGDGVMGRSKIRWGDAVTGR